MRVLHLRGADGAVTFHLPMRLHEVVESLPGEFVPILRDARGQHLAEDRAPARTRQDAALIGRAAVRAYNGR